MSAVYVNPIVEEFEYCHPTEGVPAAELKIKGEIRNYCAINSNYMKEIILFEQSGMPFCMWKGQVDVDSEHRNISRYSFDRVHVAVVIDNEIKYLVDIGACMGVEESSRESQSHALLLGDSNKIAGFFFNGSIGIHQVEDDCVYDFPLHIRTSLIKSAAVIANSLIPVLDGTAVLKACSNGAIGQPAIKKKRNKKTEPSGKYIPYVVGGYSFAGDVNTVMRVPAPHAPVAKVPFFPEFLAGIVLIEDRIVPVVDLRVSAGYSADSDNSDILLMKGNQELAMPADSISETETNGATVPLPKLLRAPWLKQAVIVDNAVLPVLDINELSLGHTAKPVGSNLQYRLNSGIAGRFQNASLAVVEIKAASARYAIPSVEIEETVDVPDFTQVPGRRSIPLGVVAGDGRLIPVVDLSGYFGAPPGRRARAILLKNGTFRGYILIDAVFEEREIQADAQRLLPIPLPHPVVYGCFFDGQEITLILDVASLIIHCDDVEIRRAFDEYSRPVPQSSGPQRINGPANQANAVSNGLSIAAPTK